MITTRINVALLHKVYEPLASTGITPYKQKCLFGLASVEYLDDTIPGSGVEPNSEKIKMECRQTKFFCGV